MAFKLNFFKERVREQQEDGLEATKDKSEDKAEYKPENKSEENSGDPEKDPEKEPEKGLEYETKKETETRIEKEIEAEAVVFEKNQDGEVIDFKDGEVIDFKGGESADFSDEESDEANIEAVFSDAAATDIVGNETPGEAATVDSAGSFCEISNGANSGAGASADAPPLFAAADAKRIFLSPPHMGWKEMFYISGAFESNWIAPVGEFVDRFEKAVCEYTGVGNALAVSSGTAAIHLALRSLGASAGSIVLCPDLTFIGGVNPAMYLGARPVFVDCAPGSVNMSPSALERALKEITWRGARVAAVITVDLYGMSANYDEILAICKKYDVPLLEDAAEALGSSYKGRKCGAFGAMSALSFNGNKIITTSGGGMVLSDDGEAVEKMRFWATQARENVRYYLHEEMGYNYRLSNICAAIGCGQMESLENRVGSRKRVRELYEEALSGLPLTLNRIEDGCEPNYWLTIANIDAGEGITPDELIDALEAHNIEARRVWKPMHEQPLFSGYEFFAHEENKKANSSAAFDAGICLPSGSALTEAQIDRVAQVIKNALKH